MVVCHAKQPVIYSSTESIVVVVVQSGEYYILITHYISTSVLKFVQNGQTST